MEVSSNPEPDVHPGFSRASWLRAAREGGWVFGGQAVSAIAGLIGIRVITTLAPKEVFGEASLLLGLLALGRNVFVAPLGNAQLRFHPDYEHRGLLQWFTRQISRLTWQATLVFAVVFLCCYGAWRWHAGSFNPLLLGALLLYLILDTAKSLRLNRLIAERRQALAAGWSASESLLTIGLSCAFLMVSASASAYLLGMGVAVGVALLIFGHLLFPPLLPDNAAPPSSHDLLGAIAKYGVAFIPLAFVGWAINVGDRYMLAEFRDVAEAGAYVAAYSIASRPFLMASGVILGFARPILFHAQSKGQFAKATRVFSLMMLSTVAMGAVGVVGMILFGPWVSKLLLAPAYRPQAPVIFVWVGIGYAFYAIVQALENRLLSFHLSRALIAPSVIATIWNVGLNVWLIPRRGAVGAAQTTAAAFFVQAAILALIVARMQFWPEKRSK